MPVNQARLGDESVRHLIVLEAELGSEKNQ
jgi:hypothetical protein